MIGLAVGAVAMWDAKTGAALGEPLRGHTGSVNSVAFSPDGKRLVSGGDNGTVRIWPVLDAWADALCSKLPRNMSRDEWRRWVGDLPYRRQCPNLPGPPDDISPSAQAASSTPQR